MPQEHLVLRCFSCETFQVHIAKKSKKWECKICGEKQSLKRNYGKGSGKDCRVQVMRLNELRLSKDSSLSQLEDDIFVEIFNDKVDDQPKKEQSKERKPLISKWAEYLEENTEDQESEDDDNLTHSFLKTDEKKKKRVKKMTENCNFKKRKICGEFDKKEVSQKYEKTKNLLLVSCNGTPAKNESKPNKYAKFLEKHKDEKDLQMEKTSNLFDLDQTDLDNILNFS